MPFASYESRLLEGTRTIGGQRTGSDSALCIACIQDACNIVFAGTIFAVLPIVVAR